MNEHASDNLFREARNIAMFCTSPTRRDILRLRCDECKETFDRFNLSASKLDFEELVGRWTRLLLAMDACGPYVDGGTTVGGKLPAPKQLATG
jgi:hypothetical protein